MTVFESLRSEFQQHFSRASTFEEVWLLLSHMGRNPFADDTQMRLDWSRRIELQRQERERGGMARATRWINSYPKLIIPPRLGSKRRLEQTVLKLPFDNLHDIKLRIERSYIFIGSNLYFVVEVRTHENDFALLVNGGDGVNSIVMYSDPAIDLRTPEPQYILFDRAPVFLSRVVGRSQKQGLSNENTVGVSVWPKHTMRVCDNTRALVNGISNTVFTWSPYYMNLLKSGMMPSLRLSKDIAVYHDGKETKVDFRNRQMGSVEDDTALLNSRDCERPWITSALADVGLRVREG